MLRVLVLLIPFLCSFVPSETAAQLRHIHSGAGVSPTQLPFWAAKDLGLFDKYGLNTDLVVISSGARGMQALIGNSIQSANMAAMSPIHSVVGGGEVVIVAGYLNKSLFKIVAQKEIRKPADLRGKRIGVANFGGSTEFGVLMALKEMNVPRETVQLTAAGGSNARFSALEAKGLDATILPYTEALVAEKKGFSILADLADVVAEFPDRLITVRRAFLEKERPHLKRFLQAVSESLYTIKSDRQKEKIVGVIAKHLRVDRKIAEENYQLYRSAFSFPPRVGRKGLATVLELMQAQSSKPKADFEIGRFIDESVIDELDKEGFFKSLEKSAARR